MKLIKYFNKEVAGYKDNIRVEKDPVSGKEFKYIEKLPIFEVRPLKYESTDEEFEYWLDVIKRTYGKYGEVKYEDVPNIKTKEEIRANTLSNLIIENKKKDVIISNMVQQINNLNIKLNKLGGDK